MSVAVLDENIAARLSAAAHATPHAVAIAQARRDGSYATVTFAELDASSTDIARGLVQWGVTPGSRLVLAVPFGIGFIRLVFALLKSGAVPVLVDPGMGRQNLIQCLADAAPDGFVATPRAQLMRSLLRRRFPNARWNVTVGRRLLWTGRPLRALQHQGRASSISLPRVTAQDPAAVIFTTGSTGPPKGVLYTHSIFVHQVRLIQQQYAIEPGSRDLACFPLFGLFDAVMGVTTIIPDMDPTRPADVHPPNIIRAISDWQADQAFGSPALWQTVASYCAEQGIRMENLRRVLSAGAPVPPRVLGMIRQSIHADGLVFTPYGATESLPIASIESREVLEETAEKSLRGAGTCVGRPFPQIELRVIQITDDPLPTIDRTRQLAVGEIGELMVAGPVVTSQYVTRTDQNAAHKVAAADCTWHRMGDVGYLDEQNRFWFCGRKSHRVETAHGVLFTVPCEAIFNGHPDVQRSALVGVGARGQQHPVVVVEPGPAISSPADQRRLIADLRKRAAEHELTSGLEDIRLYPGRLPVDIRHNSKIFREQLAEWAGQRSD